MADPSADILTALDNFKTVVRNKVATVQEYQNIANSIMGVSQKLVELRRNVDGYIGAFNLKLKESQDEVVTLKKQLEDNNNKLTEKTNETAALNQKMNEMNNQVIAVQQQAQQQIAAINQQMQANEASYQQKLQEERSNSMGQMMNLEKQKAEEIAQIARQNEALAKQKEEVIAKSAADTQAITQQMNGLNAQIEKLTQEKTQLDAFNQKLIQNITNASLKIRDTVSFFENEFKALNVSQNKGDLVRSVDEAIASMSEISGALQGVPREKRSQKGGWVYSHTAPRSSSKKNMKAGWTYSATPSASASSSRRTTRKTTTRRHSAIKKTRSRNRGMKSRRRA